MGELHGRSSPRKKEGEEKKAVPAGALEFCRSSAAAGAAAELRRNPSMPWRSGGGKNEEEGEVKGAAGRGREGRPTEARRKKATHGHAARGGSQPCARPNTRPCVR